MATAPTESVVPPSTLAALVSEAFRRCRDRSAARFIVAQCAGVHPAVLAVEGSRTVSEDECVSALSMADRVSGGEPLQYVLGTWGFRSLELSVDPRVLIPRPETEEVVGWALDALAAAGAPPGGGRPLVVDLGTGSGAIALSLALEAPHPVEVVATDASADALTVAAANVRRAGLDDDNGRKSVVRLRHGDWFAALDSTLAGKVTLLVSNPPYVADPEWHRLEPVVRSHEPRAALVAGPLGTEALQVVVAGAPPWLAPSGTVVIEMAPHQAPDVRAMAIEAGFTDLSVRTDLAGRPRALMARRP